MEMDRSRFFDGRGLNLKATELKLGLPGSCDEPESRYPVTRNCNNEDNNKNQKNKKRSSPDTAEDCGSSASNPTGFEIADRNSDSRRDASPPPAKAQVVGWPPIRSFRKNSMQLEKTSSSDRDAVLVKVSVDGAPYLRKIDLKSYESYPELFMALEIMFNVRIGKYSEREGYSGSDYAPTYEDKDGDWMLAGDVPWEMFVSTCKRLRIMKSSDAKVLGHV